MEYLARRTEESERSDADDRQEVSNSASMSGAGTGNDDTTPITIRTQEGTESLYHLAYASMHDDEAIVLLLAGADDIDMREGATSFGDGMTF